MCDETDLTEGERELERSLSVLHLASSGLAVETIAYAAGAATGRRSAMRWRTAAIGIVVLAVAVVVWKPSATPEKALVRAEPRTGDVSRIPRTEEIVVSEPVWATLPKPGQTTYLALRQAVLDRGLDALPPPRGGDGPGMPWNELRDDSTERGSL